MIMDSDLRDNTKSLTTLSHYFMCRPWFGVVNAVVVVVVVLVFLSISA